MLDEKLLNGRDIGTVYTVIISQFLSERDIIQIMKNP